MVRFFLLALVVLTLAAAGQVTLEYCVIDAAVDGVIRLEPINGSGAPLSPDKDCLYVRCSDCRLFSEGQVVICLTAGDKILRIAPDPAGTESRKTEIEAVIRRITTLGSEND
ncbi:MAG: hypothetical protein WAP20_08210 [Limnochordia bacterium]|jgi:hypothetical protein|nr:hypothetical protein [Bacillota bacterium]HOB09347.1 hypothetical protein [Limnochordia bacterium]NLH31377.1 hypothetical protein [Bacillota bacterium]HPT93372.1 hypothetical protein [Limnochordia bacterium]HPZ30443.1 hypothetical protein [Limnochordia bacterium]